MLGKMESDWKWTCTEPFPNTIRETFGQLWTAVEMRDVETVWTALPMWGVQVAKERVESNEKGKGEETRKKEIMDKIVEEAQKADENLTYGKPAPLDWAEEVEAAIEPTPVASSHQLLRRLGTFLPFIQVLGIPGRVSTIDVAAPIHTSHNSHLHHHNMSIMHSHDLHLSLSP